MNEGFNSLIQRFHGAKDSITASEIDLFNRLTKDWSHDDLIRFVVMLAYENKYRPVVYYKNKQARKNLAKSLKQNPLVKTQIPRMPADEIAKHSQTEKQYKQTLKMFKRNGITQ